MDKQTPALFPAWHCPHHGELLNANAGALHCPAGCRFEIVNNIPRFVKLKNYADAFGLQWNIYRKTQLDSYSGVPISYNRLFNCLGAELWKELKNKCVLEAGCGAGRFTQILLNQARCVTSIDLSSAVEANQANFPQGPNHCIAQADILKLPFSPQQFDFVFCLGVIQHTPNPEKTIAALYNHVKPGGWLIIDHYTYNVGYYLRTHFILRQIFKRLPSKVAHTIIKKMVNVLFPVHHKFRNIKVVQSLLGRISPVSYYGTAYPTLPVTILQEWALLDTHDGLTDWYKHFRTRKQILKTLTGLGLTEIQCKYGGNGVEARGKRPL